MLCPLAWLSHPNCIQWSIQFMKLFIVQIFCNLLPLHSSSGQPSLTLCSEIPSSPCSSFNVKHLCYYQFRERSKMRFLHILIFTFSDSWLEGRSCEQNDSEHSTYQHICTFSDWEKWFLNLFKILWESASRSPFLSLTTRKLFIAW
jgi:hypothetical protein